MAAAESGRYEEAEKWLNVYSNDYSASTNVDVNWAVDRLGGDHFSMMKIWRILTHAQRLGIKLFDSRNAKMWSRAVVYRLPECAKVLGCPAAELENNRFAFERRLDAGRFLQC